MASLAKLTIAKLKALAKKEGIEIEKDWNKGDIIAAIEEARDVKDEVQDQPDDEENPEEPEEEEEPAGKQKQGLKDTGVGWDVFDKNGQLLHTYKDKKYAEQLAKKEKGRVVKKSPKGRTQQDVIDAIQNRKAKSLKELEGQRPGPPEKFE